MKEIKFRVWDKDFKAFRPKGTFTISDTGRVLLSEIEYPLPIEEVVIQQYIGLKDHKGQDIYEGDIVSYIWQDEEHSVANEVGEVYFEDGIFYFDRANQFATNDHNFIEPSIEVIGNIYQNPELLK